MERKNFLSETEQNINRRSFLKLSGLLSAGLVSFGILPTAAEAVRFNKKMYKVTETRVAMNTFVSMTLLHPSRDKSEEAMGLAFEEIDRLTQIMSRFDNRTAVAQLNNEGFLKDVPPEVSEVISRALYHYRLSNATFDITIKPVMDLYKNTIARGGDRWPDDAEITDALKLVGADKIEFHTNKIRLKKSGMGITLDGIAKGYIVDKASKILAGHRINNHLINAGGDIRAIGKRSDKKPWVVAIQDPRKKRHYPDTIYLTDGAIATSGNYEIYFDREKIFHHIVDPKTGFSPELNNSVSVTAKTAMDADALSTAVFVMNPVLGTRFINSLPMCESFVIEKGNKRFKSAGWKSMTA